MRRVGPVLLIVLLLAALLAAFTWDAGTESPTEVSQPTATDEGGTPTEDATRERHRVADAEPLPDEPAASRHEVVVELLDPADEPVRGVRVELRHASESTQAPAIAAVAAATTDADGRARLEGPAGAYEVTVRSEIWATWAHAVELPTDEVLRIGVARGVRVRLRVHDPEGTPIATATAREMWWDAAPPAAAGADGVIDMGPVAATEYARFRVFAPGFGTRLLDVSDPWEHAPELERTVILHRGGTLRLRVLEADGSVVAGASVWAAAPRGDAWSTTGADGEVVLDGVVMPGETRIIVTAPDDRSVTRRLKVDEMPDTETSLDVVLHAGRTVGGVVVRASDGSPVANAGIYVFGDDLYQLLTRTDSEGRFRAERRPGAPDDAVDLLILAPGLSLAEDRRGGVEPGPEGSALLRVELVATARFAGRVIGPEGRPIAGASVRVQHPEARVVLAETPLTATTGADGRFEIAGVPPFDGLRVIAAAPADVAGLGVGWCSELDHPGPGARLDVGDIELPRTFTLSARVTDADGAPIPDAWLVARYRVPTENGGYFPRRVLDGAFRPVPDLPIGPAYVQADAPGFFKTSVRVDDTTEFIVIDRKCHVTGQLQHDGEAPGLEMLQLRSKDRLYTMDGNHARAPLEADGRFACGPVRPGRYEVRIEDSDLRGEVYIHTDGENLGTIELH